MVHHNRTAISVPVPVPVPVSGSTVVDCCEPQLGLTTVVSRRQVGRASIIPHIYHSKEESKCRGRGCRRRGGSVRIGGSKEKVGGEETRPK